MIQHIKFEDLTAEQRDLLLAASDSMVHSYSPYSHFAVGSAVRTKDGKVITGINVENAAYPSGICAERVAIFKAVSQGCQNDIVSIAIIAKPKEGSTTKTTGPCGGCRQVIFEFSQLSKINIEVIMATTDMKKITTATINDLFPLGFGPDDLKE